MPEISSSLPWMQSYLFSWHWLFWQSEIIFISPFSFPRVFFQIPKSTFGHQKERQDGTLKIACTQKQLPSVNTNFTHYFIMLLFPSIGGRGYKIGGCVCVPVCPSVNALTAEVFDVGNECQEVFWARILTRGHCVGGCVNAQAFSLNTLLVFFLYIKKSTQSWE